LISSGIAASAQTSGAEAYGENVNFYQLEDTVSTSLAEPHSSWRSVAHSRKAA